MSNLDVYLGLEHTKYSRTYHKPLNRVQRDGLIGYDKWHTWFAWYPVLIDFGEFHGSLMKWVWLRTVERKMAFVGFWGLEGYREVKK